MLPAPSLVLREPQEMIGRAVGLRGAPLEERGARLRLTDEGQCLCAYFFKILENFFWNRDRPPRSTRCCWPPVQAGCDLGSISSRSVSPGLPQVVRVVNSVPSVITTVTVW